MMRQRSEDEVLQEILGTDLPAKFTRDLERIASLDAFIQFSQNPTSMSAGYCIEENYPLIGQNLAKRYELSEVVIKTILTFLKTSFNRMKDVNYDVDFWRRAISDYIKEKYGKDLLNWWDSLYEGLSEKEKMMFLLLLNILIRTSSIGEARRWFFCFFDREEKFSENDLVEAAVKFGFGNILYYRSSRGYTENLFVHSLFLRDLCKKFEKEIPIDEKQVERFFDSLSLANLKLLERCAKEAVPVIERRLGNVTQTAPLIVEASKSYFAISPFALNKFKELIKAKKAELTRSWKEKFDNILNSFVIEAHPYAELKFMFEIEGAYCWEIRYTDAPEKEPISVGILLSPYIFTISGYSTILDEMKRVVSSQLNLVFLIKETLPTVTECFKYVSQRNFIFLLDEKGEKFYLIEKSEKLSEESALQVDSFLSRFLPLAEGSIQISRTWPSHLKDYIQNLKYLNKFPRAFAIRKRIPSVELKMRQNIREELKKFFGDQWKEKVKERLGDKVRKLEKVIENRPDKDEVKDFLDGATIGDIADIARTFPEAIKVDKSVMVHLEIIIQYRKVFEHPLKDLEADLEEKTYNKLQIALDFIEKVICLE
jgi:hypothetical protein